MPHKLKRKRKDYDSQENHWDSYVGASSPYYHYLNEYGEVEDAYDRGDRLDELVVTANNPSQNINNPSQNINNKFIKNLTAIKNAVLRKTGLKKREEFVSDDNYNFFPLNNAVRVTRTNNPNAIYFSEFVERNPNNIRRAKDFINTNDTLIGDNQIPLSNIRYFAGVENGKFKVGGIDIFNQETQVFPVRNKTQKIGSINKNIIDRETEEKERDRLFKEELSLDSMWEAKNKSVIDSLAKKMPKDGNYYINHILSFGTYDTRKEDARRNLKFDSSLKHFDKTNEDPEYQERLKLYNDSLDELFKSTRNNNFDDKSIFDFHIDPYSKFVLANENGNSYFIPSFDRLDGRDKYKLTELIQNDSVYPIIVDNGRYSHYYPKTDREHNYNTYTADDFDRPEESLYIIGTK